jgi:hypothetical protein
MRSSSTPRLRGYDAAYLSKALLENPLTKVPAAFSIVLMAWID